MNLAKVYMEKFIWSNVLDVNIYTRTKREISPSNFVLLLGAPEVISPDKRYAITIKFKNCLPPEMIRKLLHLEYNFTYCNYKRTELIIHDAAITYVHIDNNHLIVEMNAVNVEMKAV